MTRRNQTNNTACCCPTTCHAHDNNHHHSSFSSSSSTSLGTRSPCSIKCTLHRYTVSLTPAFLFTLQLYSMRLRHALPIKLYKHFIPFQLNQPVAVVVVCPSVSPLWMNRETERQREREIRGCFLSRIQSNYDRYHCLLHVQPTTLFVTCASIVLIVICKTI